MNWKCKAFYGIAAPVPNNTETSMSILTLAKRIVEEGPQVYPSITRVTIYAEMTKRADATRLAGETPEMAFTRIATTTEEGKALFAAYKLAPGADHHPGPSSDVGLLGPRSERPLPPPNAAHEQLIRKAEELVVSVSKRGSAKPLTVEQAFEKVLCDPGNRALAKAAVRPASMKGAELPDGDEDADDGWSPATYDDDGDNTAHNPRSAVIGRRESDEERTARPTSATRTFGLGSRKAKIAARVQKFLTMCPNASDDEALEYALSGKSVRKAVDARLNAS
jgi:hypothetical protein